MPGLYRPQPPAPTQPRRGLAPLLGGPATLACTAADSVATATEAAARTAIAFGRTAADTPAAISEAVVRSKYQGAVLADNPLAYWRLDEASGTLAQNYLGNAARNGTYVGSPTLGVTGALATSGDPDAAVTFNGTSQYASVPHDVALSAASGAFTLECLFKRARTLTEECLFAKGASEPNLFFAAGDDKLQAIDGTGLGVGGVASSVAVSDTNWHHVAFTRSGTTYKLYLDGVDVTVALSAPAFTGSTRPIILGAYSQGSPVANDWFSGSLDEAAWYGTALTATRVLAHYNASVGFNSLARTLADALATLVEAPARAAGSWARAVPDSLATLVEGVARATAAKARTTADTVATATEAAARGATAFARAAADTPATISEAAARGATSFARASSATVATLTEAAARGATAFGRTLADTVGAISEVVVAVKGGAASLTRTAADTVATASEVAIRGVTAFSRVLADTPAALTDATSRAGAYVRRNADVVATANETAARVAAVARSAAAALATLSEAAVRGVAAGRAASDALATATEVVSRITGRARAATDALPSVTEVAVRASQYARAATASVATLAEAVAARLLPSVFKGKVKLSDAAAAVVSILDRRRDS